MKRRRNTPLGQKPTAEPMSLSREMSVVDKIQHTENQANTAVSSVGQSYSASRYPFGSGIYLPYDSYLVENVQDVLGNWLYDYYGNTIHYSIISEISDKIYQTSFSRTRNTWDGIYGEGTAWCIYRFQQAVGLNPTGLLDKDTLVALGLNTNEFLTRLNQSQPAVNATLIGSTTIQPSPGYTPSTTGTSDIKDFISKYGVVIGIIIVGAVGLMLLRKK